MSGYTAAFSDIYMGTLYGRWPAAPVWATLLPLIDKNGNIDMSIQAIAGMTGWPIDLLEEGIQQLMEPDPHSRTDGHEGRRLVPIDPNRPWGWVAVNHGKYKEKARLMGKNAREKAEGSNQPESPNPPKSAGIAESADFAPHTQTQTHQKLGRAFDLFWQAYPKKRKKKTAQEIWVRKKLDSKAEVLLADINRRLIDDKRWRDGYIPDPTTYLNQERWSDEIESERRDGHDRGFVC